MLDLLLTNARIVDGTGNPWRKGCVGVRDGRIVAVGSAHDMPEARTVLDIGGNILCPGFIDSHSHSDLRIIDEPLALPKIMQGITTENVVLDSMSVAPISDKNKEPWSTSISGLDGVAQKPWGWNGFASYLNALDAAKPSVNLSSYVGLGTVRLDVMGMEDRPPTAEELRAWHERSGLPLKRFFNTSGMLYREMELSKKMPEMSEDEQYALLATSGMLVKRPLLITADTVIPGFKEASWEEALGG